MLKSKKKNVSGYNFDSEIKIIFTNASVQAIIFILATFVSFLFGVDSDVYFIISVISLCIGNFASGFIAGRIKKQKGLIFGILYSLFFNITIILLSTVLNSLSIDFSVIISFLLPVVFSCFGGITAVNIKRKGSIKR